MEGTTCSCPHPQCPHDGRHGLGPPRVRCRADRGMPRRVGTLGQDPFSVRQGPAYVGRRVAEPTATRALWALAEWHALRGTRRSVEVDKNTGCDGGERTRRPGRAVPPSRGDTWPIPEGQGDACWSGGRKQEAPLREAAQGWARSGAAWGWSAFAPAWRLGAAFGVGKRAQAHANVLLERGPAGRCGSRAGLPRDPVRRAAHAWLQGSGTPEILLPLPGPRGPTPPPTRLAPADWESAHVVKCRTSGRVGAVPTKLSVGSAAAVHACLAVSPVCQTRHTRGVEHHTLTCRQGHGRRARQVRSCAQKLTWFETHGWLSGAYAPFVLPHDSVSQRVSALQATRGSGSPKQWQAITPAMAAGLTDHGWAMEALLSERVPPDVRDRLDQQATNYTSSPCHPRYRGTPPYFLP